MIWTPRHRNNRDAAAILRQRGGGILCPVQSFIYFILLPSPDWLMDIMLQVDSTKCISIVESGATLYNDGSRWWYDEDVHINLFQVSVPAPSIHSCGLKKLHPNCIRRFVMTEKAPTRAFSWLKAATTAFTFKTLLRHYAKRRWPHGLSTWNWVRDAIIMRDRRL